MIGLEAWLNAGQHVGLGHVELAYHVAGEGPCVTLLHGFPTCSWDWAALADGLSDHRLLMPDLLGFGDSDKPPGYHYSLMEQADLIGALWQHLGITETAIVAHDIGATVALELLARQPIRISRLVLLNSALYIDVAQPRLTQRLIASPVVGPVLGRLVNERLFTRNLAAVFARPLSPEVAHDYWLAFQRRATSPRMHALLQYIPERAQHRTRWEHALEHCEVPLQFVWGVADPVSGAPVLERIRLRTPSARVAALDGVGHYPQLEAPDRVLAELRATL
jgi:pimeloyl-ACP methyl ester carboxylesterase